MTIRTFQPTDEAVVIDLWRQCGLVRPANNPSADIRRKMAVRPDLFLVAQDTGQIIGTVMAGYEGHRGWINYLAVAATHRRTGAGRELMAEAERLLRASGCPKINLQVRTTNTDVIAFYQRLGFAIDDVISMGKRLTEDEPG